MREDQFLRQRLQKEIPILRALIQNLYEELDRKLHLNGAKVPITFENLCVNPLFRTGDNLTGNFKEEYNTY